MAWWTGLAIFSLVLSLKLAGNGLRDLLDPRATEGRGIGPYGSADYADSRRFLQPAYPRDPGDRQGANTCLGKAREGDGVGGARGGPAA